MPTDEIDYRVRDGVATITFDRPEKLNALTADMAFELLRLFDEIDEDDRVRAVIVTGRGRAFCAGADLSLGGETFDYDSQDPEGAGVERRDGGGMLTLRIFQLRKPIIAAINGPAVGVGVTMTLAMDVRLAAEDARFGFVFSRRGIVPEACSSWFLPRIVGIDRALEWCYRGDVFPAAEALEGGLVRSLHPADELLPAAEELARRFVDGTSAISIALARQLLWRGLGEAHPMEAHRADSRAVNATGRSPDAIEGVTAFLEKRPPNFTGAVSTDLPDVFPGWEEPEFR
jgi:enoyl-CoA hydratase/carnithine racemase